MTKMAFAKLQLMDELWPYIKQDAVKMVIQVLVNSKLD